VTGTGVTVAPRGVLRLPFRREAWHLYGDEVCRAGRLQNAVAVDVGVPRGVEPWFAQCADELHQRLSGHGSRTSEAGVEEMADELLHQGALPAGGVATQEQVMLTGHLGDRAGCGG